jgi:hypothetical protein
LGIALILIEYWIADVANAHKSSDLKGGLTGWEPAVSVVAECALIPVERGSSDGQPDIAMVVDPGRTERIDAPFHYLFLPFTDGQRHALVVCVGAAAERNDKRVTPESHIPKKIPERILRTPDASMKGVRRKKRRTRRRPSRTQRCNDDNLRNVQKERRLAGQ